MNLLIHEISHLRRKKVIKKKYKKIGSSNFVLKYAKGLRQSPALSVKSKNRTHQYGFVKCVGTK